MRHKRHWLFHPGAEVSASFDFRKGQSGSDPKNIPGSQHKIAPAWKRQAAPVEKTIGSSYDGREKISDRELHATFGKTTVQPRLPAFRGKSDFGDKEARVRASENSARIAPFSEEYP